MRFGHGWRRQGLLAGLQRREESVYSLEVEGVSFSQENMQNKRAICSFSFQGVADRCAVKIETFTSVGDHMPVRESSVCQVIRSQGGTVREGPHGAACCLLLSPKFSLAPQTVMEPYRTACNLVSTTQSGFRCIWLAYIRDKGREIQNNKTTRGEEWEESVRETKICANRTPRLSPSSSD